MRGAPSKLTYATDYLNVWSQVLISLDSCPSPSVKTSSAKLWTTAVLHNYRITKSRTIIQLFGLKVRYFPILTTTMQLSWYKTYRTVSLEGLMTATICITLKPEPSDGYHVTYINGHVGQLHRNGPELVIWRFVLLAVVKPIIRTYPTMNTRAWIFQ